MNNAVEIILEGGPFDGKIRRALAGTREVFEALETVTDDTPQELRGLFSYRRIGEKREGRPVFRYTKPTETTPAQ